MQVTAPDTLNITDVKTSSCGHIPPPQHREASWEPASQERVVTHAPLSWIKCNPPEMKKENIQFYGAQVNKKVEKGTDF